MNNELASTIRSKVDIVDIIGERIPLTARGKNFFGICPFHDDSNPSMSVSREKQIYTCFSCHATGNVYTFLMEYEHMDFKEVLKYLGDRVGIDTGNISIRKKTTKFLHVFHNQKYFTKITIFNKTSCFKVIISLVKFISTTFMIKMIMLVVQQGQAVTMIMLVL